MTSRPRILVNFAVSLDGKINPAPSHRHGAFVMSRGKEDWRRMRVLQLAKALGAVEILSKPATLEWKTTVDRVRQIGLSRASTAVYVGIDRPFLRGYPCLTQ